MLLLVAGPVGKSGKPLRPVALTWISVRRRADGAQGHRGQGQGEQARQEPERAAHGGPRRPAGLARDHITVAESEAVLPCYARGVRPSRLRPSSIARAGRRVKADRTVVVVPTYDERDNLPVLERALCAHLPGCHLMIVDDASPDGTGAVADAIAARRPGEVHVLHRPAKRGLGRAYVAAFRRALALDYEAIVQMDCDLSHDPAAVGALLAALEAGADLALGSRYVPGGGTMNWGLGRRLVSRWGSIYARTVLGVPYRDLTGGFKAWRRETLAAIPLDEVHAQGYAFQVEMTYRAHRLGRRIVEVPITFVDRRVGQSKVSGTIVLEAAVLCWRMRGIR